MSPRAIIPADDVPMSDDVMRSSPAQDLWRNRDVRRQILQLLKKHDLTRCIRVEKDGVHDVASELYREVSWRNIKPFIDGQEDRYNVYCAAVREIDTGGDISLPKLKAALGLCSQTPSRYKNVEEPHEHKYNRLTLPFREACPNLKRLRIPHPDIRWRSSFNDYFRPNYEVWVVHLDPHRVPKDASDEEYRPSAARPLHIDVKELRDFQRSNADRRFHIECPLPESDIVVINYRFDIDVGRDKSYCSSNDKELDGFQHDPCFAGLGETFSVGDLPITLEHLIHLYNRQASSGHHDRLRYITATDIMPYDLSQLRSFAAVAASSLRHLTLGRKDGYRMSKIGTADLPSILAVIGSSLPNLSELAITVNLDEPGEELCLGWLEEDTLDREGQLSTLHIHSADKQTISCFNILRYLASWAKKDAKVFVSGIPAWSEEVQSSHLSQLRSQSQRRRKHLSVVDFRSLDIDHPDQIPHLSYRKTGRPIRRLITQSTRWTNLTTEVDNYMTTISVPAVEHSMRKLLRVSSRIESASRSGDTRHMEAKLGNLAAALTATSQAAENLRAVLSNIYRIHSEVRGLRKILRGDKDRSDDDEVVEYSEAEEEIDYEDGTEDEEGDEEEEEAEEEEEEEEEEDGAEGEEEEEEGVSEDEGEESENHLGVRSK